MKNTKVRVIRVWQIVFNYNHSMHSEYMRERFSLDYNNHSTHMDAKNICYLSKYKRCLEWGVWLPIHWF